ncbi:putative esterase YitV [Pullulanibacillus pueri]|uniref:Putative esterase YitV n=1 Tax=Pullulanibacillus pueri TaxID=1437324 RepID=A0A8J3EPH7_9BACL|nr:putative esterase YitV [Pullulanibacillus pueri]
MLIIDETKIANIPTLLVEEQTMTGRPLPLVIFWHGWTSGKESNLRYAYLAAKKGFRVILPEATGHGERLNELSEEERQFGFWQVVLQNIQETKQLKDAMEAKGLILNDRIALAGSSMGGITTYGCLRAYDWIKVAVPLMGTPSYRDFADHIVSEFQKTGIAIPYNDEQIQALFVALSPYDLSETPEQVKDVPLLMWHGMKDPVVPAEHDLQFFNLLKDKGYSDKHFIQDPQAGHNVSREGLFAFANWLEKYL